ncbi:hypothetical protein AXG93_2018s1570 [Marchantia polymorpha subsp. ruderalis]|uniref:Uncharacterized protein n=1 Tax=Marchantia polymorpha subsp. ruderalis TaxID=1480154 RepID=A0A176WCT5_MARPO|nr:hypothetical protein AXG93_2018s1570 [Marchantia polymorpha subsp. ruderalis]
MTSQECLFIIHFGNERRDLLDEECKQAWSAAAKCVPSGVVRILTDSSAELVKSLCYGDVRSLHPQHRKLVPVYICVPKYIGLRKMSMDDGSVDSDPANQAEVHARVLSVLGRRSQRASLATAKFYNHDRAASTRNLRDLLSTKLRPTAKETPDGLKIKKLDFYISQEEEPRLKIVKRDSDLEPEPMEDDYLVRLSLNFENLPVSDIPVGMSATAKLFRWEEGKNGFRKLGKDDISLGPANYCLPADL